MSHRRHTGWVFAPSIVAFDDSKKMLIRKAFEAIPAGGALVVYEAIIDDDRAKMPLGSMMSLTMLIETPGASTTQG